MLPNLYASYFSSEMLRYVCDDYLFFPSDFRMSIESHLQITNDTQYSLALHSIEVYAHD